MSFRLQVSMILMFAVCAQFNISFALRLQSTDVNEQIDTPEAMETQDSIALVPPAWRGKWVKTAKLLPCCKWISTLSGSLGHDFGAQRYPCCDDIAAKSWQSNTSFNADSLAAAFRGKRVTFIGDSLVRQVLVSNVCAKEAMGEYVNDTQYVNKEAVITFSDGTMFTRRGCSTHIHTGRFVFDADTDIAIYNVGAHYARNIDRMEAYPSHVYQAAQELKRWQNEKPGRHVIMIDPFVSHFDTDHGDFHHIDALPMQQNFNNPKYHQSQSAPESDSPAEKDDTDKSGEKCLPAISSKRWKGGSNDWLAKAMKRAADDHGLSHVPVFDLMLSIGDRHLSTRPKCDAEGNCKFSKLDCLHFCQNREIFQPIMARVVSLIQP